MVVVTVVAVVTDVAVIWVILSLTVVAVVPEMVVVAVVIVLRVVAVLASAGVLAVTVVVMAADVVVAAPTVVDVGQEQVYDAEARARRSKCPGFASPSGAMISAS
jgi:O-antigen ligase